MATVRTPSSIVDSGIDEGDVGAGLRFAVDVNRLFTDKVKPGDPLFWRLNMTFRTERATAAELRAAIHQGFAWTAPHRKESHLKPDGKRTTYRVKRNVIGVQAIGLDSDTGDELSTLAWWTADPFFAAFGAFAFGHHAGRGGWEWTPVAVLAALSLSAAAGVLLLNRKG